MDGHSSLSSLEAFRLVQQSTSVWRTMGVSLAGRIGVQRKSMSQLRVPKSSIA